MDRIVHNTTGLSTSQGTRVEKPGGPAELLGYAVDLRRRHDDGRDRSGDDDSAPISAHGARFRLSRGLCYGLWRALCHGFRRGFQQLFQRDDDRCHTCGDRHRRRPNSPAA